MGPRVNTPVDGGFTPEGSSGQLMGGWVPLRLKEEVTLFLQCKQPRQLEMCLDSTEIQRQICFWLRRRRPDGETGEVLRWLGEVGRAHSGTSPQ